MDHHHQHAHYDSFMLLQWQEDDADAAASTMDAGLHSSSENHLDHTIGEQDGSGKDDTHQTQQQLPEQPEYPFNIAIHSKGHHTPLQPISMPTSSTSPTSPTNPSLSLQFYSDLRSSYHLRSPHDGGGYIPPEIIELHIKHSRENPVSNPDELPEVWLAPPAPGDTASDVEEVTYYGGDDAVELVQRAPNEDGNGDDDATPGNGVDGSSSTCRSIQGKYGERHKNNPGIVLRYQYELIQDLTGVDWTINDRGERDGSEYLVENIIPNLEQGVGDVLVRTFFDECGGGKRRLRRLNSMVVGLDGEPPDFPLEQGECISTYTPSDPLQNYQCHLMEGAVTLYFPPNYSYSTLISAATLSTLGSIKEGMENGELSTASDKILALLFLEKSYNLKPVYPGDEVGFSDARAVETDGGQKNSGLIVGMIFLVLVLMACCIGGLYYKRRSDRELALEQEHRARLADQLSAKTIPASVHSQSRDDREESEDNGTTTSDDDDNGTTTSDDDNGTTTSEENSTTSGSKETTTDSDQEDTSSYSSDSDAVYEDDDDDDFDAMGYGNLFKKKKKRVKKAKNNIVIGGGGDEASVATGATGATGLHSESSQRTVKMKNVVLPSVLDVNINMR
eukprot:CCRYP_018650-RA/>CCRYP_018650-RA protein AED:0.36 eAED:0.36 QI:381/1/1/1/1/1/2/212/618